MAEGEIIAVFLSDLLKAFIIMLDQAPLQVKGKHQHKPLRAFPHVENSTLKLLADGGE